MKSCIVYERIISHRIKESLYLIHPTFADFDSFPNAVIIYLRLGWFYLFTTRQDNYRGIIQGLDGSKEVDWNMYQELESRKFVISNTALRDPTYIRS